MSEREFYGLLPYFFGGALGLGIVLFGASLYLLQRRRTAGNFALRRRAGRRGGRLFIVSALMLILGSVMAVGWIIAGLLYREQLFRPLERGEDDLYGIDVPVETLDVLTAIALTPSATLTPTPSATPTSSQTPMPTTTPLPSDTPTITPLPSATPSATWTPSPTWTPSATPTSTPTLIPLATNTPQQDPATREDPPTD